MTLTEFLLARIAEDEKRAREIADMWQRADRPLEDFGKYLCDPVVGPFGGQSQHRDAATGLYLAHIANPTRVLAECEAKRLVVLQHGDEASEAGCPACWWSDDTHCPALRPLALSYADHPDYRNEWRP